MKNDLKMAVASAIMVVSVVAARGQIGAEGTVNTTIITTDYGTLAVVGGSPYVPYLFAPTGTGVGTSLGADVAGFFAGSVPADVGYNFNSLYLDVPNFVSGGPGGTSVSPYLPQGGSAFSFTLNGDTIAVGQVQTFNIYTNHDTGAAVGEGTILMSGPGVGPDFYSVINGITGGANLVTFTIDSFNALSANASSATFASVGSFNFPAAVPEPSSAAALAGALVLAGVVLRRRRAV